MPYTRDATRFREFYASVRTCASFFAARACRRPAVPKFNPPVAGLRKSEVAMLCLPMIRRLALVLTPYAAVCSYDNP